MFKYADDNPLKYLDRTGTECRPRYLPDEEGAGGTDRRACSHLALASEANGTSAAANDSVRSVVTELAVEPLRCSGDPDQRYVDEQIGRICERLVQLQVVDLKSRLQRIDPTDTEQYNRVFGELIVAEQQRRQLRDQAIGGA